MYEGGGGGLKAKTFHPKTEFTSYSMNQKHFFEHIHRILSKCHSAPICDDFKRQKNGDVKNQKINISDLMTEILPNKCPEL